ncbi:unnamed protein product [Lathyrus oleraceus]
MELVDPPLCEGKFTWHKVDGSGMRRLDRFLISLNLVKSWNLDFQYIGFKETSDHSPIWLKGCVRNLGAKPFNFFNSWMDHKYFIPFVSKSWGSMNIKGNATYVLKEKLKNLMNLLKQ